MRLLPLHLVFRHKTLNQNEQDMRVAFTFQGLVIMALSLIYACQGPPKCQDLSGAWTDREGHNIVFQENGKALWLNKFGQMVDTISFAFTLNCNSTPASIDLKDFSDGPFAGKTLFGIIEWSADSIFRLCYEVGQQPEIRPKQFDPEQTMRFFR